MRTIQVQIDTDHDHLCGKCAFVREDGNGGGWFCLAFDCDWLGYYSSGMKRLSACIEAEGAVREGR